MKISLFKYFSNQKLFTPHYRSYSSHFFSNRMLPAPKKTITAIFLDIDGVIFYNPMNGLVQARVRERFKGREHELGTTYPSIECDRAAVDLFNKSSLEHLNRLIKSITEETKQEVGIILSSSWRERRTLSFLRELFKQHYFSNHLIDKTPELFTNRNKEIARWFSENKDKYNIRSFVILDDYDDGLSEDFPEQFVKCEHFELFGGSEYEKALAIALKPMKNITQNSELIEPFKQESIKKSLR